MREMASAMAIGAADSGTSTTGAPAALVRHCGRELALPPLPIAGLRPAIAARAQLEMATQLVADEGLVMDRVGLEPLGIGPRAAPVPIPAEWRDEVETHIARLRHILGSPADAAAIVAWAALWRRVVPGGPDLAEDALLAVLRDVPAVVLTSDLAIQLAAQWHSTPVPQAIRALCEAQVRPFRDLLSALQGWMVTPTDGAAKPMPPTEPHTSPPAGQELAAAPNGALRLFEALAALPGPLQGAWLRSDADAAPSARQVIR